MFRNFPRLRERIGYEIFRALFGMFIRLKIQTIIRLDVKNIRITYGYKQQNNNKRNIRLI